MEDGENMFSILGRVNHFNAILWSIGFLPRSKVEEGEPQKKPKG